MFEKVNPAHPDKLSDRLAGAITDLAYSRAEDPRVAVEVLAGHGHVTVIIETSLTPEQMPATDIDPLIYRIFGSDVTGNVNIVSQDPHLADNQHDRLRCGDNGIFKGVPPTREQQTLTALAHTLYAAFPTDGKYIIQSEELRVKSEEFATATKPPVQLTICQSNATEQDILDCIADFYTANEDSSLFTIHSSLIKVNPLGPWTGGPDVDCGATNRKLGSDMGDGVTGGGLHGKDLSKADVSVNIVCYLLAIEHRQTVTACCSIGDEQVTFHIGDGHRLCMGYRDIVERARLYIHTLGGFERFAEWGLIRHKDL